MKTLLGKFPGIYMVLNLNTNKRYVGSTKKTVSSRFGQHRYLLRNNKHPNCGLQGSWNKHGEDAFSFIPLQAVKDTSNDYLNKIEQQWIDLFKSQKIRVYNLRPTTESNHGIHHTSEVKSRIGESGKKKWTPERRQKNRQRMIDRNSDPEYQIAIKEGQVRYWDRKQRERGPITLISPSGDFTEVIHVYHFCLANNLDPSAMTKVIKSKRPSHKGWRKA